MSERTYKPGEAVPVPGIYRVTHYRHRLPHDVTIVATSHFPECHGCGNQVRFTLIQAVRSVEHDRDFCA